MPELGQVLGEAECQALVEALLRAGRDRRPLALTPDFAMRCPPDLAHALQARHLQGLLAAIGGEVIGIKLGGTTDGALKALGLAAPFTGPILSARTQASPARLARDGFIVGIVEAEIGLRLARDLPASPQVPSREALLDAIDAVFPAIEIADSRLQSWATSGAAAIVCDLGYAGAWVLGAACPRWREIDLRQLSVNLTCAGVTVRSGSGQLVLGDPLHALSLVLAERGKRGLGLAAGTVVSTGSCTAPWPLPPDARGPLVADFGALGQVRLDLI